ncbi:MAG: winged helix-turn-helix transcriptional regulator [Bacilli bacterium]|nr:winged helix-turn-helix transcriptional regulator [Bacilli bacterium]
MRRNKYVTISALSAHLGKSTATVYRHIESLLKKGLLRREQSRKAGYWELVE